MKVAVICEYSGTVRDAVIRAGHEAISFDIIPSDSDFGPHVEGDVLSLSWDYWKQFDLAICHPPCTHLAVSGARWFKDKLPEQQKALEFVQYLMGLPVERIAIENPVSIISSRIRKPDQIIQPWMFGHPEQKKTCLWLKGLPNLVETDNVYEVMMGLPLKERTKIHYMSPGEDRGKMRSKTYSGIAEAMANQWGKVGVIV